MPRKLSTTYTPSRVSAARTISCIGDSIVMNTTMGVLPSDFWPEQLGAKLRDKGHVCQAKNFGISGNTSAQVLARCSQMLADAGEPFIPAIALIAIGVNDPGTSIPQATTQSNIEQTIRVLRNNCGGVVAGQASLPADLAIGTRYLVSSDTSTTGGTAATVAWSASQPATVTGSVSGSGPAVWINRNGLPGESGWGRVADDNTLGVQKVGVVTTHYLQFSSGGDSVDAQSATYASVRAAQTAAAASQGVTLLDVWSYQNNLIKTGVETQASGSWTYYPNNQHPSVHGCSTIADAVLAGFPDSWLAALTS